jgi:hypothetical protein
LTAVPSRIAERLITGPAAFLLGGIIDVVAYAAASARARGAKRRAQRPA